MRDLPGAVVAEGSIESLKEIKTVSREE